MKWCCLPRWVLWLGSGASGASQASAWLLDGPARVMSAASAHVPAAPNTHVTQVPLATSLWHKPSCGCSWKLVGSSSSSSCATAHGAPSNLHRQLLSKC